MNSISPRIYIPNYMLQELFHLYKRETTYESPAGRNVIMFGI